MSEDVETGIRAALNAALAGVGFEPATYSSDTIRVLEKAWAIAGLALNTQVTVHHLAYALAAPGSAVGNELAACLNTDAESFRRGCASQFLALGLPVRDVELLSPAVGTVRWVGAAARLAREKGSDDVTPVDLVQAVMLKQADGDSVQYPLRRAANAGNRRRDKVLGLNLPSGAETSKGVDANSSKPVAALITTASPATDSELAPMVDEIAHQEHLLSHFEASAAQVQTYAEIATRLGSVEQNTAAIAYALEPVRRVESRFDAIGQRFAGIEESLKSIDQIAAKADAIERRVAEVAGQIETDGRIGEKLEAIAQRAVDIARAVEPANELLGRLDKIDRRMRAIEQGLPRPPSGLRLAAAISVVLAIGLATGLVLTQWHSTSRAADSRPLNLEQSR